MLWRQVVSLAFKRFLWKVSTETRPWRRVKIEKKILTWFAERIRTKWFSISSIIYGFGFAINVHICIPFHSLSLSKHLYLSFIFLRLVTRKTELDHLWKTSWLKTKYTGERTVLISLSTRLVIGQFFGPYPTVRRALRAVDLKCFPFSERWWASHKLGFLSLYCSYWGPFFSRQILLVRFVLGSWIDRKKSVRILQFTDLEILYR